MTERVIPAAKNLCGTPADERGVVWAEGACSVMRLLLEEVKRLWVRETWDQEWAHCEGCQRYTRQEDMRTNEDDGGSCCLWCLKLDEKEAEVERLQGELAQSGHIATPRDSRFEAST